MRCNQPSGVTQVNSQASSECPGMLDCTTIDDSSGSMPAAMKQRRGFANLPKEFFRILINGDGVQVDDAEDTFVFVSGFPPNF